MEEDCLGARFEILLDGRTQYCRDTLATAMGGGEHHPGPVSQEPRHHQGSADWRTDCGT